MVDEIIQTGIPAVDELNKEFKVHTMRRKFPAPKYPVPDLTRHFVVRFDESKNLDDVVSAFSKIPLIEKVERVGVHELLAAPNDHKYGFQWYLGPIPLDHDIDAPEAWDIQTGSDSVILAIPDSGVKYTHPDLDGNIWINWDEYYGIYDYDDDGNGYKDDIYGWDWSDNDNDPMDYYGHGTHCAGIAAAETNNNLGVAGVAGGWGPGQPGCRIMCLRIAVNILYMDDAASAFNYATDKGVTAINCSWASSNTGGFGDAVDYAIQNGVLVVVAAGNDNANKCDDFLEHYLNTRSDVMVVAATDSWDEKADFSNYGPCIDVSAPGVSILNTCVCTSPDCNYEDYYWKSGTSMAAPMVVGVAGLLKSERPDWGRIKIWDAIVVSTDDVGLENMGSGRLNAYNALRQTLLPSAPSNLDGWPTAYNQINLSWQDNSDNELGFKIERRTSSSGFSEIGIEGKNVTSYQDKTCSIGVTYYYRIKAYNVSGDSSYSNTKSVTIPTGPPTAASNLRGRYNWRRDWIVLRWTDNSNNEEGFEVYCKDYGNWVYVGRVGPNTTYYIDEDIDGQCGSYEYYKVHAYNEYGYSPPSNTAEVEIICK